ncbi:MAG TPA: SDR family NAD(P)-dependent oxidoreductase [Cyclobacteriaceae bacterium]|nr:SDR family NAD(P)-dependent oxidoreductase [Cyclobacteriaceae bacterium]
MKKVAIVTGAAGNLGQAVTAKLIKNGFHVTGIVSSRTPNKFVNSASIEMFQADLGDESVIREIIQRIFDLHKKIDVAVLTAGGFAMGDLKSTGKKELDHMYRLNFETAYFSAREIFQIMETQTEEGRIFLVGAKPGLEPSTGSSMVAYTLMKSLLTGLSDMLNKDGNPKGIFSTLIVPSVIDSPANRIAMPTADFSKWVSPEIIADKILDILSEEKWKSPLPLLKLY